MSGGLEYLAAHMLSSVALGAMELHKQGLQHGDEKPANFLYRTKLPVQGDMALSLMRWMGCNPIQRLPNTPAEVVGQLRSGKLVEVMLGDFGLALGAAKQQRGRYAQQLTVPRDLQPGHGTPAL